MAHSRQAKKRARQTANRTIVNRARLSRARTSLKKVESAIASGDREAARAALREAEPVIMRSAQKGVIKRNTASRRISRLSHRVKAMPAA